MIYQVSWQTLPGLRGLSCSGFAAHPTMTPDQERGVAIELADDAERDALLHALEAHFVAQRFSNNASAFETVKSYILEWSAKRKL